jgi:hypothetical protein
MAHLFSSRRCERNGRSPCGACVRSVRDVQSCDRELDGRGGGEQRLEPGGSCAARPAGFNICRLVRSYLSLQELSGTQGAVAARVSLVPGDCFSESPG